MFFIFPANRKFTQKIARKTKKDGHQNWYPLKRGNTRKPYVIRIASLAESYTLLSKVFGKKKIEQAFS
jgi:hypothetical protein